MNPTRRTGIVRDPRYGDHCMGPDEPECPARLAVLDAMLAAPDMRGRFHEVAPRRADPEDLLRVHSPAHLRRLADTEGRASTYLDADTSASPHSNEAAQLAAGGLCEAIRLVCAGRLDNAFALVRPPGHHAERAKAKGFCLYNNVAIGARFAQQRLGLSRILVVDWDLHHGNGTQNCFAADPSVLVFSTHRAFFYPGSGRLGEVGKGPGRGYTVNIPLLPGFGDGEYLTLFDAILKPVALEFRPDLVLVSAGFDIHTDDPMGGMKVTSRGFAGLTRAVLDIADACCGGRLLMTLEGGYDLAALRDSVGEVLKELSGMQTTPLAPILASADRRKAGYVVWRVKRVHRKYWKSLALGNAAEKPSRLERARAAMARVVAYFTG
jgi:acetoin utilization deacetylase AcuC-like enzyme